MIRRAEAKDAEALLRLERETEGAAHWGAAEYAQILKPGEGPLRRLVFVAEERGDLQGFIVVKLLAGAPAEIENLAVAEKHRRRGVGAGLCRAALQAAHEAGADESELEVGAVNSAATNLYAGLGFTLCGKRKNYYAHTRQDALLMKAKLPLA